MQAATLTKVKDTIGTLLVPPPPPLPATVVEGAHLYRALGVPPDADFEEIQEAVKALKMKYADDRKMQIKIDITKEQISELRLQQRLSGALRVDAAVAKKDSVLEKYEDVKARKDFEKKIPSIIRVIPSMWQPWWVKPVDKDERRWAKAYIKSSKLYFVLMSAVCVLLPGFIGVVNAAGNLCFTAHISQRGRPPLKRTPNGQVGEVREEKMSSLIWGLVLVLSHFAAGRLVGDFLAPFLVVLRPKQARALGAVAGMTLASLLWQPYAAKVGMKRKSSYQRGGTQDM